MVQMTTFSCFFLWYKYNLNVVVGLLCSVSSVSVLVTVQLTQSQA